MIGKLINIKKSILFLDIWGFRQTFFKICGRLRPAFLTFPSYLKKEIAVIGCGQFSYSNLAPRLLKFGLCSPILYAYDINESTSKNFCSTYNCISLFKFPSSDLDKKIKLVYICSNHSSHFDYSCYYLNKGIDVYSEKPLTTNKEQVFKLAQIISKTNARLFSGYNRPHSPIIKSIKKIYKLKKPSKINILCSVKGHLISSNHWYRNPDQGTRIYGNLSHWVDLCVHIIFWLPKLPKEIIISLKYFDDSKLDENISCEISDNKGFTFTIFFFSLMEPITGVHESIEILTEKFTARINNFKSLEIDFGSHLIKNKYRKKSAGHSQAIKQPFINKMRDCSEFFLSELILFEIVSMTSNKTSKSSFNLEESIEMLYLRDR